MKSKPCWRLPGPQVLTLPVLTPRNPWSFSGAVADRMKVGVEGLFPELAARWKQEAGVGLSLAATAAQQGITPISTESHQELMSSDPTYQAEHRQAQQKREQELLAQYEKKAAQMAAERQSNTPDTIRVPFA